MTKRIVLKPNAINGRGVSDVVGNSPSRLAYKLCSLPRRNRTMATPKDADTLLYEMQRLEEELRILQERQRRLTDATKVLVVVLKV
jgi:hypothetical protein